MSKLLVTNEIGLAEVLASSPGKQCRTTIGVCEGEENENCMEKTLRRHIQITSMVTGLL